MTRLKQNEELVKILSELIQSSPEQRFSQILRNYLFVKETRPIKAESGVSLGVDWKNEFYLESQELLDRVKRVRKTIEDDKKTSDT